jgi:hypothetical protein
MNKFKFWHNWLLILASIITGGGLLMVILCQTPIYNDFNKFIFNIINLQPDFTIQPKLFVWIYSVLGATMAGWGLFIWFVVKNAFRKKEKWSWFALLISSCVWFIPDTTISEICGAYLNVYSNCLLFLALIIPLWFTRYEFGIFLKQKVA